MTAARIERYNPNFVAGNINDGPQDLRPPHPPLVPYASPDAGLYLRSSSAPPGGGVHGLRGSVAARAALRRAWSTSTGPPTAVDDGRDRR